VQAVHLHELVSEIRGRKSRTQLPELFHLQWVANTMLPRKNS